MDFSAVPLLFLFICSFLSLWTSNSRYLVNCNLLFIKVLFPSNGLCSWCYELGHRFGAGTPFSCKFLFCKFANLFCLYLSFFSVVWHILDSEES